MADPYQQYEPGYGGYVWGSLHGQDVDRNRTGAGYGSGYNWITDPNAPWNQMMNMDYLNQQRSAQMVQLQRMYQQQLSRGGKELQSNIGNAWFNTGAGNAGVESSIPSEAYATRFGQLQRGLTESLLQPGMADISSRYAQQAQAQRQAGLEMLYNAMQAKGQQSASARSGVLSGLGALLGTLIAPGVGTAIGAGLGGSLGGGQNYNFNAQQGAYSGWRWDPKSGQFVHGGGV